jgi:hypothetical protein
MMTLLLPRDVVRRLIQALNSAGSREIGGVLMGEHVADDVFRVRDLTIQKTGGGLATFLRSLVYVINPLYQFFRSTNNDFTRFNYLGEWHSHPSFTPDPSPRDHKTMRDIVEDPEVGAYFVVLLVVKLFRAGELDGSVTVYRPGLGEFKGNLVQEGVEYML